MAGASGTGGERRQQVAELGLAERLAGGSRVDSALCLFQAWFHSTRKIGADEVVAVFSGANSGHRTVERVHNPED